MPYPVTLDEAAAVFDARASTYEADEMHRWLAMRAASLAGSSPDDVVVDVAGGTGLAARASGSRRPVVVDISAGMLREARNAGGRGVVRSDAHRLPLRDGVADVVLCVAALLYLSKPDIAVAEWRRTCKSGARVVVSAWCEDGISYPRRLREAARAEGVSLGDTDGDFGTPERAVKLLMDGGFVDCEVEHATFTQPNADPALTWRSTSGRDPELASQPPHVRDRIRDRFLRSIEADPQQTYDVLLVSGTAT